MPDFEDISQSFRSNTESVYQLLAFDRFVLDHVVGGLSDLAHSLEEQGHRNASLTVANRVATLQNIRNSDSLRPRYATIFNQCVVLLVSYFGSAVHSLFSEGVSRALRSGIGIPAASQEVKLAWRELNAKDEPLDGTFAELLVSQKDISFQDMQSITRAFKEHIDVYMERDIGTNDIILGQASRHVIVHAGGVVDVKMARQVTAARPRRLKEDLRVGESIQFEPSEVQALGATMIEYVDRLVVLLNGRLAVQEAEPPA